MPDCLLSVSAKFVYMVKYSLLNSWKLLYVILTRYQHMAPLSAEDRLLIRILRIEKGWDGQ